MLTNTLTDLLARLDFALINSMHIIYPPLTIGLSLLLFFGEWRWLRTESEHWYRLTRFFEKLFIINFGAGVATGVTMELAFGILYAPFATAAGPVMGHLLGFETITAFMYEAGFVGLMVFGWHKINRHVHLFATFNVALASSLSAFWILAANSWMQTPTGIQMADGNFIATDWMQVIFNPDALTATPHMLLACLELSLFFVAGVAAWQVLKNRHTALFARALKAAIVALVLVSATQIYVGDDLGLTVAKEQPAALAAMEGHYHTLKPDGSTNTDWNMLMWPNMDNSATQWSVKIPHLLSLLETRTWDSPVTGLDHFPANERPPTLIPFYAFRVMVAIGFFLFLVSLWGLFLWVSGKLKADQVARHHWFLRTVVFSAFLPYLAIWTGWWTREVARQPWIVYGLMRTAEGHSPMSLSAEILWFVGFMGFGLLVLGGAWYFMAKVIRQGPDMEARIPLENEDQHDTMGSLPVANPMRAKP